MFAPLSKHIRIYLIQPNLRLGDRTDLPCHRRVDFRTSLRYRNRPDVFERVGEGQVEGLSDAKFELDGLAGLLGVVGGLRAVGKEQEEEVQEEGLWGLHCGKGFWI